MKITILLAAATVAAIPFLAHAASSDWHETEGMRIRLVTEQAPEGAREMRAALEIQLEPGWKTYWRDPGDSGVPPSISFDHGSGIEHAEIEFPVPEHFDDGYSVWAGYGRPVSFAVTLERDEARDPGTIEADVFLGVCQDICIPVQARLSVEVHTGQSDPESAAIVEAAFAALPAKAGELRAETVKTSPSHIVVEAKVPEGVEVTDLFIAGTDAYVLGSPKRAKGDGGTLFEVPVEVAPKDLHGDTAHYTLATSKGAVSGTLAIGN